MIRRPSYRMRLGAALLLVVLAAAGCASTPAGSSANAIAVKAGDESCEVANSSAAAGVVSFTVRNSGNDVTEFELFGADGTSIVSEVENIGPGITKTMTVELPAGSYVTACRPGMAGDGIRAGFTVTAGRSRPAESDDPAREQAVARYLAFVRGEVGELRAGTKRFAAAYQSGQDAKARSLYPTVRAHYERIEPVAESFGDLDAKLDLREADLAEGQTWSGWHLVEKQLWLPKGKKAATPVERKAQAAKLVSDTDALAARVNSPTFTLTISQICNGATSLIDEIATGKVTGEEETFSHTDLVDFQANLDGSQQALESVRTIAVKNDPDLVNQIDKRFANVRTLLDAHRSTAPGGFVSYTELSTGEVASLSRGVNALGGSLSGLASAVLGG